MDKVAAWEGLKGNAIVKRACEVALAGHHTLTVIGHPQNGEALLRLVMEDLLTFVRPCSCGWYGDRLFPCLCSVLAISRYRRSRRFAKALSSDVVVELVRPGPDDYRDGEPFARVLERIEHIGELPRQWTASAQDLLQRAISRLPLTLERVGQVNRVAGTIAALGGCQMVEIHHCAEAIQYSRPISSI